MNRVRGCSAARLQEPRAKWHLAAFRAGGDYQAAVIWGAVFREKSS